MPGPDGKGVMHAELLIGDSIIMMGEENPQATCKSAETMGVLPSPSTFTSKISTKLSGEPWRPAPSPRWMSRRCSGGTGSAR